MNPRIVNGLRTGEPGALGELFDAVGEDLFQYCWLMVRGREAALAVVRDTLIVAHAHIGRLGDPGQLRLWLYALARAECQRYALDAPDAPDAPEETVLLLNTAGDDARLMAWDAVMSLPLAEREMLDLTARIGMSAADAGLVTGLGADAASLIEQARMSLQQAMAVEIAARRPGAAPGKVSPAKVYARLPWPAFPPGTRADILACFIGERQAGRLVLVASRVPPLDPAGFPQPAERELASPAEPALPVPEAAVPNTAVASTVPDGLPVACTPPDGLPAASTPPDGWPGAGGAVTGIDAGHRSAVSPSEPFSRTRPVPASPVRVTMRRRIAVGMLAAAVAVGAVLVLAMAGLSLPGSTWSAPPVGSAVAAAGAPDGGVAHASSGERRMWLILAPSAGSTGHPPATPGFKPGLGPGPVTRNAAGLYLAIAQPRSSRGPTTGGRGAGQGSQSGQPSGPQPGPVSSTSVPPPPPVGSPVPSGSGSPNPSGSASPSPPPSTPPPSTPPPSVSPSAPVSPSLSSASSASSSTSVGSGSPAG